LKPAAGPPGTGPASPSNPAPLFRTVMANAALLLGGRSLNAPLSLAYLALSARALGVHDFGVVVLVNAFALTLGSVVKFESWQAVLHYGTAPLTEGRHGDFHRILRFSLLLDGLSAIAGLALGLAGAAFLGPLMGWPREATLPGMAYVTSTVFMVAATPTGVLRVFGRFDQLALQSPIGSAVRVAGAGAVFLLHGGVGWMLAAWYAGVVASFLALSVAAVVELRRRGHGGAWRVRGPLTAGFPGLWRFVWATNLSSSLDQVFTQTGSLAVGGLLGPADAGFFRIARQVATAIAKPAQLVVFALYPELARLQASGDHKRLRQLAGQVGLAGGAVGTALLLLAVLLGRPVLTAVLGPGFAAAEPVLVWLVAAAAIGIWALPLEPILISTGRAGTAVRVRLAVSVAFLAVLFPATHAFGLSGAGAASVAASLMIFFGLLIAVLRWSKHLDARTAGSPAPAALDPDMPASAAAVTDGEYGYRQ
jgi:O-antigen/teichoic acid export membrane protein